MSESLNFKLEKHDKDKQRIKRNEQVMEAEARLIREAIEKADCKQ